jgi:hypothetical protein
MTDNAGRPGREYTGAAQEPGSGATGNMPSLGVNGSVPEGGAEGNIAPHHLEILAKSGISPEFAAQRGYETINESTPLAKLKLANDARNLVPGLQIPLRDKRGSVLGLSVPAR